MTWKLVIGNRRYSSWSLRAALVVRWSGVACEETLMPLGRPDFGRSVSRLGGPGLVPVLIDGETTVWDSLAICEYVAEAVPEARLWPEAAPARARARSVSAEMHAGFMALRSEMPMEISARWPGLAFSDAALADVSRIETIWSECRSRYADGGPFLFGERSIADAMYAPVVLRFETYGIELEGTPAAYAETILGLPEVSSWRSAADAEEWTLSAERGDPAKR